MNKENLIQKLKQLDGLTTDERAALIDLVKAKKKYGLVWEDKPEAVEDQLRQFLPVLKEVKEKRILAKDIERIENATNELFIEEKKTSKNFAPNHIIIEGDNLHALTALTFTHEGQIDVIYIDPPYNTGKATEFKYNDKYVDEEDSFRHSKWLSFMDKRLRIAKTLLSESGLIIINIDDHEVSQLNLLCNDIFNQNQSHKNSNQIGLLVWDLGTGTSAGHFTRTNEFILVFSKNKSNLPNFSGGEGIIDDRAQKKIGIKNPASTFRFPAGMKFEAPDGFELTGKWGGIEETTLLDGRMICEGGKLKQDVTLLAGWTQKNQMISFFDGNETIDSKGQKVIEFYFKENGKIYCKKDRSKLNPPSVLRDIATTKQGSSLLKDIFNGEEPIQFVKPIQLIEYFLQLLPDDIIILDFFAGSGTTLHATMKVNEEGGGLRQCILVTNNENNICEEVTYVRARKVIEGYTGVKGNYVSGLNNNNLRYYKSEFVSSTKNQINRRLLAIASTELLQIKESCYIDITETNGFNPMQCGVFTNEIGKYMIVVYHSRSQNAVCEQLIDYIKTLSTEQRVKLYAFSPEKETIAADFDEVANKIDALPLPDAIYNAYRATFRTLRLDRKIINPAEAIDADTSPELFVRTTEA